MADFIHICIYFKQKLWPAIRSSLKTTLEETFTPEVETAWRKLIDNIGNHMAEGLISEGDDGEDESSLYGIYS